MFQDEARFGRMVRIRRCWAQAPQRPTVSNGYEREFVYVYGAVSPLQGQLDWMIAPQMNTVHMSEFLAQVSAAHADEFIVMVVDGASSHVAKDLVVPHNMQLLKLPPYAPELNPQEHVWDELREKAFPTEYLPTSPAFALSSITPCLSLRPTAQRCAASQLGLGCFGST